VSNLDRAAEVVSGSAAQFEALDGGAVLLADGARLRQAQLQRLLKVHERAVLRLVHVVGPQRAVEVHPLVDVVVEQAAGAVGGTVAQLVAEHALPRVVRQLGRHQRHARAEQQVRQLAVARLLVLVRRLQTCHNIFEYYSCGYCTGISLLIELLD
jgi:hypothetical protein